MAEVITRLKLESTQYDSKLRDTAKSLAEITRVATNAGRAFGEATQKDVDLAKSLGTVAVSATNNKDKVKELVGAYNDLANAYNTLTKQQQESDFGQAMSKSLEQLKVRIGEAKQELYGLSETTKNVGGGGLFSGDKLSGMLQVFGGNVMTKIAGAGLSLASELGDAIKQGIELAKQGEGIRIAFERLGRGDILQGLREATHGTVTDLELMKAAVKFNDFKLPVEELGTMLAFAQQKAKDTGQSVDYMVDSIVTGLGRKSLMILDNLGLSANEIKEKMKQTGDMTKAVGEIIREQMSKAGDYVETAADRAAQATVSLQNKMEELGRKFAPVEEASNQLWTSMKISILDIIGGPLATLLNQLTEAGRLKNALNNLNGDGGSGNTVVGGKLKQLQAAKNSGASQYVLNFMQNSTVEGYNRQITKANELLKQFEKNHSSVNVVLQNATKQFGQKFSSISELEAFRDAYKVMIADYRKGASEIMKPVKVDIQTDNAIKSVDELKVKLAELQAQRKKVKAGTDEAKRLDTEIRQVKADIKLQNPNALKTTHTTTPQETAANKVKEAERTYAETLMKNSIRMEAGLDSTLEYKKRELSAQERLFDAYNDAYATYQDPAYKKASTEAAEKIRTLAGEVKAASDAQEAARKSASELAATQKKVSDAMAEAQTAYQNNDLKGYLASMKKAGADASQGMTSDGFTLTTSNLDAFIGNLKEKISQSDVGTELYNKLTEQLADANALSSVIEFAVQNGLDTANINPQELFKNIFSEDADILDDFWKKLSSGMGKQAGKKFEIDTKTGKRKERRDGKDEKDKDFVDVAGKLNSGITSMVGSLEQMGVDIPEGFKGVLGGISGAIGVLQSIMVIVEAIEAMQTVGTFLGIFHKGGVVHAAGGVSIVPGNRPSGDTVPALLESGEVVLNRAQVNNLSSILENGGGMQNLRLEAVVTGEQIRMALNNNGRRTGRGEYVQSNRR